MPNGSLVIVGATGATGSRVAALAHAAGITPVLAGRRLDALRRVLPGADCEIRTGSLEPADLDRLCAGADVVVASVGPYTHHGSAVLEAAIRAGAHYVDFRGEPRWVARIADSYADQAAAAGSTLVPSVGLGAAGDMAGRLAAAGVTDVASVTIAYRIIGMTPSAATALSTIEILAGGAPRANAGVVDFIRAGRRSGPLPGGRGMQFPTPDAIALGALWPQATIESYMQTPLPAVSGRLVTQIAAGLERRTVARRARAALHWWARRTAGTHHGGGGRATASAVVTGGGRTATARVHVADVYDFTGRAGFAAVQGLLTGTSTPGLQAWGQVTADPLELAETLHARVGTIDSRPT